MTRRTNGSDKASTDGTAGAATFSRPRYDNNKSMWGLGVCYSSKSRPSRTSLREASSAAHLPLHAEVSLELASTLLQICIFGVVVSASSGLSGSVLKAEDRPGLRSRSKPKSSSSSGGGGGFCIA